MAITMKYFITGGAGFIGSNLVDRLMENKKNKIIVYDNLSSGKKEFIEKHIDKKNFNFIEADLLDFEKLKFSMKGADIIFHLAANSNIPLGIKNTYLDLKQNTLATYNVLEAMRINGIKKIVFTSSQTVYGETGTKTVTEDFPTRPISLYGASKLACEALITAYSHLFDIQAWIFRFANIVGKRQTHGVIIDFINKLKKNPDELEILGDGNQTKSYMLVDDCIDGILFAIKNSNDMTNIFNLGNDDQINVKNIAEIVAEEMHLKPKFKFTGGIRGWKGDVPVTILDTTKIKKLGWKPRINSEQSIKEAVRILLKYDRD